MFPLGIIEINFGLKSNNWFHYDNTKIMWKKLSNYTWIKSQSSFSFEIWQLQAVGLGYMMFISFRCSIGSTLAKKSRVPFSIYISAFRGPLQSKNKIIKTILRQIHVSWKIVFTYTHKNIGGKKAWKSPNKFFC